MTRPHPVSLILLWLALLVAAAARNGLLLALVCLALVALAFVAAPMHLRRLLRRSRWLLLTLFMLFAWMTPGTPLGWVPGMSIEGLQLAAEHVIRLLLALAALALILQLLSPVELVAGMRSLLAPLALFGLPRDRIAVRLALTLEEVERAQGAASVSGDVLHLPQASPGTSDALLGLVTAALAVTVWLP